MAGDELVDVVDEKGEVLEKVSKHRAHEFGLLHKTVISEVIDSSGRWLLVKQSLDRQDAGQYVAPVGGHVRAGENNESALAREAHEELGILGELKYKYVGFAIYNRYVKNRRENHLFVVYKIYSDVKPVLNHEAESCKYFLPAELKQEIKERPLNFGAAFLFVVDKFSPELR